MIALPQTLLALGILLLATVGVLWLAGVPRKWAPAWAVLRGLVQLWAISLVLGSVITNGWLVGLALLIMFTVASATSTHRLGFTWAKFGQVAAAMLVGALFAIAVIFATGALEFSPRYALAIGGIIIGNSMSIATLTGRRFRADVENRWDEVEGWLSVGATPRQSAIHIARDAASEALVPSVDQTRTLGLVTLPGSFVGAIFGGASPLEAGRFQILVLAGVLTAGAITAVLLITWTGKATTKPVNQPQ